MRARRRRKRLAGVRQQAPEHGPPAPARTIEQLGEKPPPADSKRTELISRVQQTYLDERKLLVGYRFSLCESNDKWLLTLGAGAFGLSLTFFRDLINPNAPAIPQCLWIAWASFALCVLFTLYSLNRSVAAATQFESILDRELLSGPERYWERVRKAQERVPELSMVVWLNRLAPCFFVLGVILLSVFVAANTKGSTNAERQRQIIETSTTESSTSPTSR